MVYEKIIFGATIGLSIIFVFQLMFGNVINFVTDGMFIDGTHRMPLYIIESTLNVVGFLIITYVISRLTKLRGVKFGFYFV